MEPTTPVRVLLVDDDARFAQVVSDALVGDGYDVVGTVPDAAGVDQAIDELQPDVLVLDLVLGSDDGLAVAEGLRARGEDVPVVMFSSLFDREMGQETLESGFGWVEKAAGPEALESAIDAVIDLRDVAVHDDVPTAGAADQARQAAAYRDR